MAPSRSSDSVSTGQIIFRLSIPLFIVGAAVAGFFYVLGQMTADVKPQSSNTPQAALYTEAEWIPNARMGSVLPGRFVFEAGARDVIVISRVHERTPLDAGEIDRLWLQLPTDIAVGKPVELSQIQAQSDLGFDRGVYRDGVFAVYPQVTGTLTIQQRTDDWIVLEIRSQLKPPAGSKWSLDDYFVAYRTPGGHHAQQVDDKKEAAPVIPHARTQPAVDLVGQWYGEMFNNVGQGWFDCYFQFEANGRFAHSTGRGGGSGAGYSAGMKYGTWQLHGNRLTMRTEIFVFDEPKNNDHMDHFKGQPVLVLEIVPVQGGITLVGDFRPPTENKLKMDRLKKVNIPDLFNNRPNPDRKPGFFERPEPSPSAVVQRGEVAP